MKVSCSQKDLTRALQTVKRAVPRRTTLPITQNVLLAAEPGELLRLSTTNLEMATTTWIEAEVEETGAITVPARSFAEMVASLPQESITMAATLDQDVLGLTCGATTAYIDGTKAEEFPPIPEVEGVPLAKIAAEEIRTAIDQVINAAATDDTQPILTGVQMEVEANSFTVAAADGFRLAVYTGHLLEPAAATSGAVLLIPAASLKEVRRLIAKAAPQVEITMAGNHVAFRIPNTTIVSQLIEGRFPNYSDLIPTEYSTRLLFDAQDMLRAVKILARVNQGIIRLQTEPGQVILSAQCPGEAAMTSVVPAVLEGEKVKIAFNAAYLLAILPTLEQRGILELSSSSSPGLFRGRNDSIQIVMPILMKW